MRGYCGCLGLGRRHFHCSVLPRGGRVWRLLGLLGGGGGGFGGACWASNWWAVIAGDCLYRGPIGSGVPRIEGKVKTGKWKWSGMDACYVLRGVRGQTRLQHASGMINKPPEYALRPRRHSMLRNGSSVCRVWRGGWGRGCSEMALHVCRFIMLIGLD